MGRKHKEKDPASPGQKGKDHAAGALPCVRNTPLEAPRPQGASKIMPRADCGMEFCGYSGADP